MKQVHYIILNEKTSKDNHCDVSYRVVPHLGLCCYVSCPDIGTLVNLRKHWPEAPILGESEIDLSATYAPVRVNPEMNALRREMSDLP